MFPLSSRFKFPRVTGQYKVPGTDSFRLACSQLFQSRLKMDWNNIGRNMQNWEKSLRELVIADPNYIFVQVDQAGAEALIVAFLCRAAKYRSLFLNGIKPHTYLAFKLFWKEWTKIFGEQPILEMLALDIAELKQHPRWKELSNTIKDSDNWVASRRFYHMSKKTIHAGSYGMHGKTFRLQMLKESGGTIVLSQEQADLFLNGFHTEFPEIREWHSRVLETSLSKEELRNLFDYPFKITGFIDKNDIKDLISWVPQSTVACITRQAYIRLQRYIEDNKLDWHLLGDTHDSYLCMVPIADAELAAKVMKEFIEIELISPFDKSVFRMKSEAQSGFNWAPRKEKWKDGKIISIENPEGLLEVGQPRLTLDEAA